jgi:hypothetical protein
MQPFLVFVFAIEGALACTGQAPRYNQASATEAAGNSNRLSRKWQYKEVASASVALEEHCPMPYPDGLLQMPHASWGDIRRRACRIFARFPSDRSHSSAVTQIAAKIDLAGLA